MGSQQLDEWFSTRRWRVFTEADGTDTESGHAVTFRKGKFRVEPPGAFTSPLGNTGRNGVMLQEVGAEGRDIAGSLHAFGESVVTKAREVYHAVI
jgi:hypothetical protein